MILKDNNSFYFPVYSEIVTWNLDVQVGLLVGKTAGARCYGTCVDCGIPASKCQVSFDKQTIFNPDYISCISLSDVVVV